MENISSSSDFVIVGDEEELHIHGDEEDGKLRNHGDEGEKQVNVIECGKEDVRSWLKFVLYTKNNLFMIGKSELWIVVSEPWVFLSMFDIYFIVIGLSYDRQWNELEIGESGYVLSANLMCMKVK